MNTNLEATTLEPTCLYATGIYNTTSITSWTNCGDSSWCFVKSGTCCLDVRPCLKCWWMWQHDSFHTTWNWMINTHMWDAVSAMLFTSAWHLTHQHIQLTSNVNSKKITANNTIPTPYLFSKLYGRLCTHHNSFNSISVAKPTHTHPWYEPQTNLPENDSIKLTNNNHTHVYHMLFHVLMCTNWSHVGWSSHFLIHIQHLWSKFNTCDTTSIFMIYDVM